MRGSTCGCDRRRSRRALAALRLPAGVRAAAPGEASERISNVSRAYRVNLTVLALVAMFTGAFLVFSILALSVAQRSSALALLAVLGLTARGSGSRSSSPSRRCSAPSAACSASPSAPRSPRSPCACFGGDLGGGYFPRRRAGAALRCSPAPSAMALLGVVAALVGGWLPARSAQRIAPAQA